MCLTKSDYGNKHLGAVLPNGNHVCCRSNTWGGWSTTGAALLLSWTALRGRLQSGKQEQTFCAGPQGENKKHCLSPSIEIAVFTL